MADQIPSAVPANQQPAGATGISEGPDGKMYFHDIAGKQLGLAPDDIQKDDSPTPAQTQPQAFNFGFKDTKSSAQAPPAAEGGFDFGFKKDAPTAQPAVPAPDPSYVGHNFDPLNLEDWKKAYAGPTTAAGQPLPPALKEEASGVSDIFHGDIRQGLHKIAAADSMHVIQGSPIEKMIQMINPSFKGGVDQAYIQANTRKDAPAVDAAQFIDKNQHPAVKALTEVTQSLTTPTNTAIMIGTGGLGMVSGPGLAVGSKLLSAGFTAQAVGQAYKNLEGFKKAYDEGDINEAVYQLTHAVANGTLGYIAGANTAGVETPLVGTLEKKIGRGVADTIKTAGTKTVNAIGSAIGRTADFDTAIERSSKIPAKQRAAHAEKIANVSEDLQALANENAQTIEDPKTFADAIDKHIQEHEGKLQETAGVTKDSNEPVAADIETRLRDRLDKFFDDNRGRYGTAEDVDKAKQEVMDRVLQTVTTPGEPQTIRAPNLFEAENIRRGLNADAQPQYQTNAKPTTDAYKVGAVQAANELRSAIDESYEQKGIDGVKEWRQKEANLIDVRDRLKDAQVKADQMGEGGVFRSLMKKIGVPSTVIAIALGHPISGAAIGAAVLGDQISQNLTNPNVNVNRALDLAAKNPGAKTTEPSYNQTLIPAAPPVDHGLHADLATHYGETLDRSTPEDLENRFTSDIDGKLSKGLPLEPEERKLLGKINESKANIKTEAEAQAQKDAEKAQAEAEKAQQETEKEKAEKEAQGLKTNMAPPFAAEAHPEVPDYWKALGKTGEIAAAHELGHHFQAAKYGNATMDIIDHQHPSIDEDALAQARWDPSKFYDDRGEIDLNKVRDNIDEFLDIFHGGPVAEDVVYGTPIHENYGAGSDLDTMEKYLQDAGFSPSEAARLMMESELRVRKDFTNPGVKDVFQKYTRMKEKGLRPGILMSDKTSGRAIQEFKNAIEGQNETNESPNPGKAGKGNKESNSGGIGGVQGQGKKGTRSAGETGAGAGTRGGEKLKTNSVTRSEDELTPQQIIENEGLKYKGELVKGSGVHMFEHPDHPGQTAALKEPMTAEQVHDKMISKLKEFERDHTKDHQGEQ